MTGMLADAATPGDAVSAALHLDRDLELLGSLGDRLTGQGIRAEVRKHLLSLLVFRGSALPVCVFVSGNGRFYSWESGRSREHVGDIDHAASQLAELVRSPARAMRRHLMPCRSLSSVPMPALLIRSPPCAPT
jgi:hypothetical protein